MKVRDETCRRRGIDGLGVALLLDAAGIHHRDAVGERQRLALVVGDEDEGAAELLVQAAQLRPAMAWRSFRSSAASGSSSSSTRACRISARASAPRCCCAAGQRGVTERSAKSVGGD